MVKYIFISLALHLTVIYMIYGFFRTSPSENISEYKVLDIQGIAFLKDSSKEKYRGRISGKAKGEYTVKKQERLPVENMKKEESYEDVKPLENAVVQKKEVIKKHIENKEEQNEMPFSENGNRTLETPVKAQEDKEYTDYTTYYKGRNLELIREIIAENIEYPIVARRMGWEGTVVVKFPIPDKDVRIKIPVSCPFSSYTVCYCMDRGHDILPIFP